MSDSPSNVPEKDLPEEVALALRTRTLIKMGVPLDDPRMKMALTQLYIWPQLLFDPARGEDNKYLVEVRVDEAAHTVDFSMTLATVPDKDDLATRGERITAWVQQLLGEDWLVFVQNKKSKGGKYKIIYRGDRRRPMEAVVATDPKAPFPDPVNQFRRYRQEEKTFTPDFDMELGPILQPKK